MPDRSSSSAPDQPTPREDAPDSSAGLAILALATALIFVVPWPTVLGVISDQLALVVTPAAALALVLGIFALVARQRRKLSRGVPIAALGIAAVGVLAHGRSRPADWRHPVWRRFGFVLSGKLRFQYRYSADGRTATLAARADLDCNGKYSSYKLLVETVGEKLRFRGPLVRDELE